MPAEDSWRVRVVLSRYGDDDAKEIAAGLRDCRSFERRNVTRRDFYVVVIRHVPVRHAQDTLSAMIHTLDVIYRNWPEGHTLPRGGETVSARFAQGERT